MKEFTLLDKEGLDLLREYIIMGYGKYSLNYWKDEDTNDEYVIYTFNMWSSATTTISHIEKIKGK
jgi:hypothetical protein